MPCFLLFANSWQKVYTGFMLTNTEIMNKGGRPINVAAVNRVKELRDKEKLTFRGAKAVLERELNKKLDIKTVYRWYRYKV